MNKLVIIRRLAVFAVAWFFGVSISLIAQDHVGIALVLLPAVMAVAYIVGATWDA